MNFKRAEQFAEPRAAAKELATAWCMRQHLLTVLPAGAILLFGI